MLKRWMIKYKKLLGLITRTFYITALMKGVAAAIEHESILARSKSKTIIDVGANRGQFSLAARNTLPHARIYAFEPLRNPIRKFDELFSGDSQVRLFPFALGSQSGETMMHVSRRDDSSSLLPIGEEQSRIFPKTQEIGVDIIQLKTLDEVLTGTNLKRPVLLKIDVQGYELEVLKGARELLKKIDIVYIECSFKELYINQPLITEVMQFLFENGFNLKGVYNQATDNDGSSIQADFYFESAS